MKKQPLSNKLKNRFSAHAVSPIANSHIPYSNSGFTIVELLVVIVVIGILAAITIVSYTGISSKAISASLQSDLSSASKQLKIFQVINGSYPTANNCPTPGSTEICLKSSPGNTLNYLPNPTDYQTFNLTNTNTNNTNYRITDNSAPLPVALVCPFNFIVVPGSSTYGTSDFCVMKYGAKQFSATVPISQAAGLPWTSISQTNSASYSSNVVGCTGCHLITEAEYLTIVQNVLKVGSNWSTGTVGSGYIYYGHSDNNPTNAIAADTSDSNGYANTSNTSGNQRRTLTLSNGEVIWDLAGNVWEWTSGTVQSPTVQPGITGTGSNWREWTAVTNPGTISPNPSASATGITGASSWNSGNGIGLICSNTEDTGLRGFLRGGAWNNGGGAGVLTLDLRYAPSRADTYVGFRVSR